MLRSVSASDLATTILSVREGKVQIDPGHDGEYGKISVAKAKKKR